MFRYSASEIRRRGSASLAIAGVLFKLNGALQKFAVGASRDGHAPVTMQQQD